jgi:hypothetical protein
LTTLPIFATGLHLPVGIDDLEQLVAPVDDALTLASTQFGPRMLRSFVRDRGT